MKAPKTKPAKLIIVTGNLGAGKTTLLNGLARISDCSIGQEAVKSNPYLEDFYNDMRAFAFRTQIYFMVDRLEAYQRLSKAKKTVLLDRSLYEDGHIFAPALHSMGYLEQRDFETYRRLFTFVCKWMERPDLIIYVSAPLSVLYERIESRGLGIDNSLPQEYLTVIQSHYDNWIERTQLAPIMFVDSTEYDFRLRKDLSRIVRAINSHGLKVGYLDERD